MLLELTPTEKGAKKIETSSARIPFNLNTVNLKFLEVFDLLQLRLNITSHKAPGAFNRNNKVFLQMHQQQSSHAESCVLELY